MRRSISYTVPLVWIVLVVVLDQLTKMKIMQAFQLYEAKTIIPGFFDLTYITNTGAAFGMFAGAESTTRQLFFLGIGVVALVAMYFAYRHYHSEGKIYGHAIGMIAGGAVGNLIDRLRFGSVVDFLDFYVNGHHWPAFNVADSAITVGVGLFILGGFICSPDKGKLELNI